MHPRSRSDLQSARTRPVDVALRSARTLTPPDRADAPLARPLARAGAVDRATAEQRRLTRQLNVMAARLWAPAPRRRPGARTDASARRD